MIAAKSEPVERRSSAHKPVMIAMIVVVLAVLGLYGYSVFSAFQPSSHAREGIVSISESTLEEMYGLRVQLIAVTAAGGLVDLRLRIIDGQKAKVLLNDQANFPELHVGNGVVLQASQDITSQTINFDDGSNLFVLYPNSQNVVKPGDPVTIVFGDLQVEAIQTR
jgi:hypothetical protein